jgi:hypothetical protein
MIFMEYRVRSSIKVGKSADAFVDVNVYEGRLPDLNFIKGAIQWNIGNVTILSEVHWDAVDLLWFFLLDGVLELKKQDTVEVHFPAQPLSIWFFTTGPNQVRIKILNFAAVVDRTLMIRSICDGARSFFARMVELAPELKAKWDDGLRKVENVESSFPQ